MKRHDWTKLLLICGIVSALFYTAMNIFIPMTWPQYDWMSQTVSELSAIGAPTRTLWNWLCIPYSLLNVAFSVGVLLSARSNKKLGIAGFLLFFLSMVGLLWPFAPMHQRISLAAGASSLSDMMHIGLGILTELLFLLALYFTASAFGKRFRIFSVMAFLAILLFGFLTFLIAPDLQKSLPTPFLGVWERINIGVFLLWTIVLALMLLYKKHRLAKHPVQM